MNHRNRTTVADMIAMLQTMPEDAEIGIAGTYETYDGFSHPEVVMRSDGSVEIREAIDPEYDDR